MRTISRALFVVTMTLACVEPPASTTSTSSPTPTADTGSDPDPIEDADQDGVTAGLTIDAGAEVVFEENGGLGVYDNGFLNAVGTAGAPIVFRGLQDLSGYWRGIHTETTNVSNEISSSTIQNAGGNYVYCCNVRAGLLVKAGTMRLEDNTINDNDGCGVHVGGSRP